MHMNLYRNAFVLRIIMVKLLTYCVRICTILGFLPGLLYSKANDIPSSSVSYALISFHWNSIT